MRYMEVFGAMAAAEKDFELSETVQKFMDLACKKCGGFGSVPEVKIGTIYYRVKCSPCRGSGWSVEDEVG